MNIKLIIFDLDGVLVDSRDMHYHTLNDALKSIDSKYIISYEEHLAIYDGLSTTKKLNLLTKNKGLCQSVYDKVWDLKQKFTFDYINNNYIRDDRICEVLKQLKYLNYILYVASNSIYNTIKLILLRKGFMEYIDYFISNEDVTNPKPSPEIYMKCCIRSKISPHDTLILEDSHIGRTAAINSGCHMMPIINSNDIILNNILYTINNINKIDMYPNNIKWLKRLNVVIPMAGLGSRFEKAGYTFPKPLIDVNGKPMIQLIVENLGFNVDTTTYIYIVQRSHYEKYNLHHLLNLITNGCKIILVDGVTEGAACSVLLAKEFINNDENLIMANSDQYIEWNHNEFMYCMDDPQIDAGIVTFKNSHPKWSYAKLNDNGFVCEVAEKKVISDCATVGIYYWKKGSDFVKYSEQMINKNIRVNNEFYVCPVFNEAIDDNKKIKIWECKKMWGIGTPEDLDYYLNNFTH